MDLKKSFLGAIVIVVFPAVAMLFWYGQAYIFNFLMPQWFRAWPLSPETLTDNYLGGVLTLGFGLVLVAFWGIWKEHKMSQVTHERRTKT